MGEELLLQMVVVPEDREVVADLLFKTGDLLALGLLLLLLLLEEGLSFLESQELLDEGLETGVGRVRHEEIFEEYFADVRLDGEKVLVIEDEEKGDLEAVGEVPVLVAFNRLGVLDQARTHLFLDSQKIVEMVVLEKLGILAGQVFHEVVLELGLFSEALLFEVLTQIHHQASPDYEQSLFLQKRN